MELPGMNSHGLLSGEGYFDENSPHVNPIFRNLDHFFKGLYDYYVYKGLLHIILTQICQILTLGFIIAFSVFLLGFVKWTEFSHCHDEESCGNTISKYITTSPFAYHSGFVSFLFVLYIMFFTSYWVYNIKLSMQMIYSAFEMEIYYREKLGVSLEDIHTISWNEIITRVIHHHNSNSFRIPNMKEFITEHDIVLRIMRKENYMIALINKQLLNIRIPWWAASFMSENLFLTKSLEWSLSLCTLEYMFTEQYTISIDFLRNQAALEQRFYYLGLVHLALLPFMLIFMIIHFFLMNAQQFHSSRAYLGPRQWSPLALWTFREFNELPHLFEERINKSYEPATSYLMLFYNPYLVILARFVSYLAGAFIAVLLLVSVLNEGILLFVHVSDHNLLWYLGIFTAIFAAARSMIPPDETSSSSSSIHNHVPPQHSTNAGTIALVARAEELLEITASHTHHYPANWVNTAHTKTVCEEFRQLLPYKVQLFAMEIFSIILTPIVLCFSLPLSARAIIAFVRDHSKYVDGVGAVCDYSLFDLAKYGNEKFGAAVDGNMDEIERPRDGKLEQSYMNFRQANPGWEGDETAKAMEERLHLYRLGKEYDRDLHNSTMFRSTNPSNIAENLMNSRMYTERPYESIRRQNEAAEMVESGYGDSNKSGEEIGQGDDYAPRSTRPLAGIFGSPLLNHIQALSSSIMPRGTVYAPIASSDHDDHLQHEQHQQQHVNRGSDDYSSQGSNNQSSEKLMRNPMHGMGMMVTSTEKRSHDIAAHDHDQPRSGPSSAFISTSDRGASSSTSTVPVAGTRISGGWSRDGYDASYNTNILTTTPPSGGADDSEIQLVSPVVSRQTTLTIDLPPSSSSSAIPSSISNQHYHNPYTNRALSSSSSYMMSSPKIRDPIRRQAPPVSHPPPFSSTPTPSQSNPEMIHSALKSFLRNENIDYENDFYWMTRFKKDRMTDPVALERSVSNSRMMMSGMTAFSPRRGYNQSTYPFDSSSGDGFGNMSMGSMMMTQSSIPINNPIRTTSNITINSDIASERGIASLNDSESV